MTLPKPMQSPLRKPLQDIKNFSSVVNVFINLQENGNGGIAASVTRMEMAEDMVARRMSYGDKGSPRNQRSEVPPNQTVPGYCKGVIQWLPV